MTNEEFWSKQTQVSQLLAIRQTAKALEIAGELVAARPDSVRAHELLTRALARHGNRKAALKSARKILELVPESSLGWHWVANLEWKPRLKRAAIEKALRCSPGNPDLHACRAAILIQHTSISMRNLWSEIEKSSLAALELRPEHVQAHGHLALAHLHHGRFDMAREQLKIGLNIEPENARLLHILARYHNIIGQYRQQETVLRESLRLDPTNQLAQAKWEFASANANNTDLLERIYDAMFRKWPRFLPLPFSIALIYGAVRLFAFGDNRIFLLSIPLGMVAVFSFSLSITPYWSLFPAAKLSDGFKRYGKSAVWNGEADATKDKVVID